MKWKVKQNLKVGNEEKERAVNRSGGEWELGELT